MDADIAALSRNWSRPSPASRKAAWRPPSRRRSGRPRRAPVACRHTPPQRFRPGQPLEIELSVERKFASARLYYRHVNHAERYETAEMECATASFGQSSPRPTRTRRFRSSTTSS